MTKPIRVAVALFLFAVAAMAASEHLAVADQTMHSVLIVGVTQGNTVATIPTGDDSPDQVLATRDGSRIVAISRGPGKSTWLGEFRPTAVASATVIDAEAAKVLQRVELGWDASDAQITADDRMLIVLSPGVDAKPPEAKPAALYAIDLRKGTLAGKLEFDRVARGMLVAGDHKAAAVYFEGNRRANRPNLLRFVDLASMTQSGDDISLPGEVWPPATFAGHDFIYVAEKPQRQAGKMYVVSASQRKLVGTYPVQENPGISAFDDATGRVFVNGRSASKGEKGQSCEWIVFRNGAPEKTLKAPDNSFRLAYTVDRKDALLTGSSVTRISLDALEVNGQIKDGAVASEIHLAPDGRRAYFYLAGGEQSSRVTVFDLAGMTQMKSFMVGSSGMRWAKGLAAAAVTAASYSSAHSAAVSSGQSTFFYSVYTWNAAKAGRGMMAVRPDSKFAYAVDPNTGYVSVIDGETGERLNGIRVAGAYELVALKDNAMLAVPGSKGVTFIDTAANDKSGEVTFDGDLRGLETTPDRSRLIALYDGKLAVFDDHGKLLGDTSVKKPVSWVFLP